MDTVMELEIGPGPEPGSYVVQVLRSVGGGEPTATIRLELDELVERRPLLEASVLSSSVSARRVMSDTEAAIQQVGVRLFDAMFAGDIGNAYRTSMAVASERGRGVQIALRLTAPGLAALPWEAMFDSETQTYICRKEPLVRQVPAPHSAPTLTVRPPLRILAMVSSPRGLPMLDIDAERERLEGALRQHLDAGRVELHWLDDVMWAGVHGKLLEGAWHVLHFIGHGGYDIETDEGVLAFSGPDGRAEYVTASSLADLLDEAEPTPRLVVLNSCQSGAAGTQDLFSGTAAALAHSGIRAVAAMQFSISDPAAIAFARGFYTALAHGRTIDEAMRSGRIGILGKRGTLEWVTPVLYLRGDDARLFDVASVPATAPASRSVAAPVAGAIPIVTGQRTPDASPHAPTARGASVAAVAAPILSTSPATAVQHATPVSPAPAAPAAPPAGPARPAHAAAPPAPPAPPQQAMPAASAPPPSPPRRSSWKPWLVVGIVALLAVGGAIAAVIALSPTPYVPPDPPSPSPNQPVVTPTTFGMAVPMYQLWTPTGIWCATGDTLDIQASGTAYHNADPSSLVGPDGLYDPYYHQWNIPGLPDSNTASLIGVLNVTTAWPFYVGYGTSYTCPVDGWFYLGINDVDLNGNSGEFWAVITHTPSG
ncbi:CHAT domain-containing protein [Agromyces sp. NPDC058484]|uniref:CHAT domain-containing protein n=1 Tax=Agromyces sp. NPDC058484 TaxID=3346524 RepID=UPI00365D4CE0